MITIIVPRGFIQKLLASHLGKKLTVFMKISFIAMFTKPAIWLYREAVHKLLHSYEYQLLSYA